MEEPDYSLVDLIESNSRYASLKESLSGYVRGSDEYFIELFKLLPLSSWPTYKTFLRKQAIQVENSQYNGFSPVYRSSLSPDRLVTCVDQEVFPSAYHHFKFAVRNWPDNDCLGYRPFDPLTGKWESYYQFESYADVDKRIQNIGSGILTLVNSRNRHQDSNKDVTVPLDSNDFIVSILSHNRMEWVLTDLACQAYSLANTALYETLGPTTSEYILNLTESPVLVFAKSNFFKIISILPKLKFLRTLICMDDLSNEELTILNDSILSQKLNSNKESVKLFSLKQVEMIGSLNHIPEILPLQDSLYTISFTSGTTGVPKGVEMTHQNVTAGIAFGYSTFKIPTHKVGLQLHDMCFLPLAHIFQRMIVSYDIATGTGIGFIHKPDPTVLVEDLNLLKPDTLSLVPRVLTKFEAGIKNSMDKSSFQRNVATNILESKQARFTSKGGPDKSVINYLVFHRVLIDKIRESLGLVNASYLVTGSAPISNETLLFLRSALDVGMRQGYGLTETFAGICLCEPHERDPGTCGAIGISSECRLKSVPQMGYHADKDYKGELQVRGPQVFKHYYKNDVETKRVIDEEGWFSTGDIAFIDKKGRISVIDRVKNFFKLAQGEYVAPEKIENIYLSSCPHITQIFLYGNSLKTYLVGIVGIDPDSVQLLISKKYPQAKAWTPAQLIENINSDIALKRHLLILLNKDVNALQGFEKLHNIYVDLEPLTVEDDVITPTLKIKRHKATKHFKKTLDALYEEGSMIKNGKL
ncbi:hypothetical protein TBLA_0D04470 [Henningerozyma blattae CBS 6284]|uniref:AMP-dependent synthetase/ligase domain-containing protein n=1 Tax=Henningerozyma blattae (strain ATCC 34711 / CBS 6284 / DSM 70876 / NBRC 10599 / NRRL Y-10934 / UCD 77-7) TaxID=1071380 RepID=I2H3J1_HENB6|nr:hypothetical protein TBLA_0D04470 [Tetrapisispora blattae CBS 6284]CCH60943.1 hypothetical protein TBLA_0D04470 [Tetrapisispora blattae CBS 6284]